MFVKFLEILMFSPKGPMGSGKWFNPGLLGTLNNFHKIVFFYPSTYSMRKVDEKEYEKEKKNNGGNSAHKCRC